MLIEFPRKQFYFETYCLSFNIFQIMEYNTETREHSKKSNKDNKKSKKITVIEGD